MMGRNVYIFLRGYHPPESEGMVNLISSITIYLTFTYRFSCKVVTVKRYVPDAKYPSKFYFNEVKYYDEPKLTRKFFILERNIPLVIKLLEELYLIYKFLPYIIKGIREESYLIFAGLGWHIAILSALINRFFNKKAKILFITFGENRFKSDLALLFFCFLSLKLRIKIISTSLSFYIRYRKLFENIEILLPWTHRAEHLISESHSINLDIESPNILYLGSATEDRLPFEVINYILGGISVYKNSKLTLAFPKTLTTIRYVHELLMQQFPKYKLNIVVKNLTLDEIEKLFKEHNIIIFLPKTKKINVVDPPLSIIEAMAYGLIPIINNNSMSLKFIIKNGYNGFIIDSFSDIDALLKQNLKYIYLKSNIRENVKESIKIIRKLFYFQLTQIFGDLC